MSWVQQRQVCLTADRFNRFCHFHLHQDYYVSTSTLYCRACRCLLTSPVQHWINYLDLDLQSSELIFWDAFVSLNDINTDPYQSVSHMAKQLPNFGVNESASTKYRIAHWIRFVEIIMIMKLRYGWNTSVTKVGISRVTRLVQYRRSRYYSWVGIMGIIPVHKLSTDAHIPYIEPLIVHKRLHAWSILYG